VSWKLRYSGRDSGAEIADIGCQALRERSVVCGRYICNICGQRCGAIDVTLSTAGDKTKSFPLSERAVYAHRIKRVTRNRSGRSHAKLRLGACAFVSLRGHGSAALLKAPNSQQSTETRSDPLPILISNPVRETPKRIAPMLSKSHTSCDLKIQSNSTWPTDSTYLTTWFRALSDVPSSKPTLRRPLL